MKDKPVKRTAQTPTAKPTNCTKPADWRYMVAVSSLYNITNLHGIDSYCRIVIHHNRVVTTK